MRTKIVKLVVEKNWIDQLDFQIDSHSFFFYTRFGKHHQKSILLQDKNFTMYSKIKDYLTQELKSIEEAGLFKNERNYCI